MKFEKKIPKGKRILSADFKEDVYITYFPSEEPKLQTELQWHKLALPVIEGQEVGEVLIFDAWDRCIKKEPIFATKTVEKRVFSIGWLFSVLFLMGMGFFFYSRKFWNKYIQSSRESS
jgi:hypothetical protein